MLKVTHIKLHQQSRTLEIHFNDGLKAQLPLEYLRVYSPSAEVQGHGQSIPKLVTGKSEVSLKKIEPVGNYAIRLVFDDGHDSGLYSWSVLHHLAINHDDLWLQYQQRLEKAQQSRASLLDVKIDYNKD